MKKEKVVIINMRVEGEKKEKKEKLKRQAKVLGGIVVDSVKAQLSTEGTYTTAAGIGLIQGFKYGGSLKRGVKAGAVVVGVLVGINVVGNVVEKWDYIKNA